MNKNVCRTKKCTEATRVSKIFTNFEKMYVYA